MVGTLTNYVQMYVEPDSDVSSITSLGNFRLRSNYGFVTVEANNGGFAVYSPMFAQRLVTIQDGFDAETGYVNLLKFTNNNSTATNTSTFVRKNITGDLQFIDNANSATIFAITDSGEAQLGAGGLRFTDTSLQTTAFTSTNAVTSITAGTGTYVSTSTGAVTIWTSYQRVAAAATTATSTASGIIFITDNGSRAAYYNTTASQWLYIGTDAVVYTPPAPGSYDPYYASLVYLLEASVNGDLTANTSPSIPWSTTSTQVLYSNTSSWYSPGSGSYIQIASSLISGLSTGNWTLDWWMWNDSSNTGDAAVLNWVSGFEYRHETGSDWHFYNFFDGIYPAPFGNPTTSAWTHVAMERDGGTFNFYINGVKVYNAGTSMNANQGTMQWGSEGGSKNWAGYMDYLRLTTVARYGGTNFTPPTSNAAYLPAP
jgi:hypothetical protein